MLSAHESTLAARALDVLDEARKCREPGTQQTRAVRLALRALYGVLGHKSTLRDFWHWSGLEDPNHRSRNLQVALDILKAHVELRSR
jgi:hypothetical protein